MKNSTSGTKLRHFAFIHYCEPYLFLSAVAEHTSVSRFIYIYHDKDVDENGKLKTPHYHTILTFENPHYLSGLLKLSKNLLSGEDSTVLVKPIYNKNEAFLYLTHEDEYSIEQGKYLYDTSLLCSNDLPYYMAWAYSDCDNDRTTEHFIVDLLTLSPFKMALKWGRDYIKNFRKYAEFISYAKASNTDDLPLHLTELIGEKNHET